MNVILAITENLQVTFKKGISSCINSFTKSQGHYQGEKKTYKAKPDQLDIPSERKDSPVVTTIDEKLEWFENSHYEFINAIMSQEATNASGTVTADLIVDGVSWGNFSSLELLRLKNILSNYDLYTMYKELPTRSLDVNWKSSTNPEYDGRNIWETALVSNVKKTGDTKQIVLVAPTEHFPAVLGTEKVTIELGDTTWQSFSGAWSHRERASVLTRFDKLKLAVEEALKLANQAESIDSELTGKKLFGYLHYGVNQ